MPRRMAVPIVACLSAAAALVLTSCGGSTTDSAHRSTPTTAIAVQAPSTTSAAATPESTTAAARPTTTTGAPPATKAPPKATPKHRAASKKAPLTEASISKGVSGPSASRCMQSAGLIGISSPSVGEWKGMTALNGPEVFVDGPYTSTRAAQASADSLQGVEDSARGGLYVVTALLVSRLTARVDEVARCLATSRGHGGLQY
jgi:hypothetical protein